MIDSRWCSCKTKDVDEPKEHTLKYLPVFGSIGQVDPELCRLLAETVFVTGRREIYPKSIHHSLVEFRPPPPRVG